MCIERTIDFKGNFLMRIGANMSFFKIPYIRTIVWSSRMNGIVVPCTYNIFKRRRTTFIFQNNYSSSNRLGHQHLFLFWVPTVQQSMKAPRRRSRSVTENALAVLGLLKGDMATRQKCRWRWGWGLLDRPKQWLHHAEAPPAFLPLRVQSEAGIRVMQNLRYFYLIIYKYLEFVFSSN